MTFESVVAEAMRQLKPYRDGIADSNRLRDQTEARRWEDLGQALEDLKRSNGLIMQGVGSYGLEQQALAAQMKGGFDGLALLVRHPRFIHKDGTVMWAHHAVDGKCEHCDLRILPPAGKRKKK
jgi:hypothetical protein